VREIAEARGPMFLLMPGPPSGGDRGPPGTERRPPG
jgi:hypothetical protein